MFAKRAEGRNSRGFVHVLEAVEKLSLLSDFWVNFLPWSLPGGRGGPGVVAGLIFYCF